MESIRLREYHTSFPGIIFALCLLSALVRLGERINNKNISIKTMLFFIACGVIEMKSLFTC